MKTLSFHQPWAELILRGCKTVDLRTWRTRHRGRIAIHAGQTVNREACAAHGLDPEALVRGALLGTVEIVDVEPLDGERYEVLRGQHLSAKEYPGKVFGWRLRDPQRLPAPVPALGRRMLYDTPDEVLQAGEGGQTALPGLDAAPAQPEPAPEEASQAGYDPERPFELRVVPREGREYGLAVYQWATANGGSAASGPRAERLVEIAGDPLRALTGHVLEGLRRAGYPVTELSRERREPFRLPEESGLRLGLVFLAVRRLARMDRVEAISSGVRSMPSEEAYYWFSKCTARASASNAQRALRILLAGE